MEHKKIIQRFYSTYRKLHKKLENHLVELNFDIEESYYASTLLNKLMCIYFLEKNGIMPDKNFLLYNYNLKYSDNKRYYKEFLIPLFLSLNTSHRDRKEEVFHKIPYLNISIFDIKEVEYDLSIDSTIFKDIFLEFNKYKWSLVEVNEGMTVTPSVLGSVFEKYINQREMGAYYTEKDTTDYITKGALMTALITKFKYQEKLLEIMGENLKANPTCFLQLDTNLKYKYEYHFVKNKMNDLISDIANEQNINVEFLIRNNIDIFKLLHYTVRNLDNELINELYKCLLDLKILDPTAGTGAFILSAVDMFHRMFMIFEEKVDKSLIKKITQDAYAIENKEFIYLKYCVENNLFAVDIMDEAIEILKMRIYLRLLSSNNTKQVEALPDIGMNFKAGNALVGDISRYHKDYNDNYLNNKLYSEYAKTDLRICDFNNWKKTFKPFHWGLEFREVFESGGFDCIIGNPPYIEYTKVKKENGYFLIDYKTLKCGNLYAFTLERSYQLLRNEGVLGMIVPISIVSTPRMQPMRKLIREKNIFAFYSNFGDRPGTLFTGVHQKLTIVLSKKKQNQEEPFTLYTSQYYHWYKDERDILFKNLFYTKSLFTEMESECYYKIGDHYQFSIINKINRDITPLSQYLNKPAIHNIYLGMRMTFWTKCFIEPKESKEFKRFGVENDIDSKIIMAILNSSLFFMYWEIVSDCWHITSKELDNFKIDLNLMNKELKLRLYDAAIELEKDLEKHKVFIGSKQTDYEYRHKKSKLIIDKIDELLKEHYNFTEAEFNYIKHYNLKYRMSDEMDMYNSTTKKKELNAIDLFSGAGGFSVGFKKAGFDIILANEIDPQIAETYKVNHEDTIMINMDIKNFAENTEAIINEKLSIIKDKMKKAELIDKLKNVDVIIGGPPCQGFSMAGSRIRQKNAFMEDPRNYLFKYYFKVIQKFEPNYFIMENVDSLLSLQNGKIIKEIERLFESGSNFKKGGYYLSRAVLNSADFGVPQSRRRLIIIGSKYEKINLESELENVKKIMSQKDKKRFEPASVKDAISDLSYLDHGQGVFEEHYQNQPMTFYQSQRRRNSEKLYNHTATKHKESTLERIMRIAPGQNWKDLSESDKIKSVHSGAYGRLVWDEIAVTITTRFDTPSGGRFIHPELNRALTPREAARIQSFDDDFVFLGNKTSIQTQIGNAVPPLLAEVLANLILEDKKKRDKLSSTSEVEENTIIKEQQTSSA